MKFGVLQPGPISDKCVKFVENRHISDGVFNIFVRQGLRRRRPVWEVTGFFELDTLARINILIAKVI
jgi:hypothetical protein